VRNFFYFLIALGLLFPPAVSAQLAGPVESGKIGEIKMEGTDLIDAGILFSAINSTIGNNLSPLQVARDIKEIFKLGYFENVQAQTTPMGFGEVLLTFVVQEKPRISLFEIEGMNGLDRKTIDEKLKVHRNNMVNLSRIERDLDMIEGEYKKKGFLRTRVSYRIEPSDDQKVHLYYTVDETPKVYLSKFHITGTKFFYPLDVERLMQSAEIDCFAWATESGVFQESKINQDLALITQEYLKNGFIKVHIDKPKIVLTQKRDLAIIDVYLHITEGEQYFVNKVDIEPADENSLLFDKEEKLADFKTQPTEPFNPFKLNQDRFTLNEIYMEQGYAYAAILPRQNINEEEKTVDITFKIHRREKAYIGRVEVEGNFETQDPVVRRELEVHDNELFNGTKVKQSQENITRLGFFQAGYGVQFEQQQGDVEGQIDYLVKLSEAQTGSFNASLSYSGFSGLIFSFGISKKNLLGTGKNLNFSVERRQTGQSLYSLTMMNPYFFDSLFNNEFSVYSQFVPETGYDVQTTGFYTGLSYPIWKHWRASTRYSFKNEKYTNVTAVGQSYLNYAQAQTYRSLQVKASYTTVDNPTFPSNGLEANLSTERFGGILAGTTEYQATNLQTRYFKSLNDDQTIIFMGQYRQSQLDKTNPSKEIPTNQRFYIGGITTVRGHEWNDIIGPSSFAERPADFDITKAYPYQGDYADCATGGPNCPAGLPETRPEPRNYYNSHQRGILQKIFNLEMLFPLTREGRNIRGLVFFDAGNVWSEDRIYDIMGLKKDPWYFRRSAGTGIRMITPMGVLRFEYGMKLDKKPSELPSRFDFHVSGLF